MIELKCYDTLTGGYVKISVTDEIGNFIKRSHWREEIQERRFNARRLVYEDSLSYNDEDATIEEVIQREENSKLYMCMLALDERARRVLYYRYFHCLSLMEIADRLGISTSYASKLIRRAQCYLRDKMLESKK